MTDSSDTNADSSAMDSSAPSSVHGEESREQSVSREHSPPVQIDDVPPLSPPTPSEPIQLKRSVSSRLPVPKKFSIPAPISVPSYGSLRPAPSKESTASPGLKSASPRVPTIPKRQSKLGGPKSPNTAPSGITSPESPSIYGLARSGPRSAKIIVKDHTSHTATSLAKRASVPSLTRKPSTSTLTRKASASQLQSVVSTPPRRVPSNGPATVAPPLVRKPSNSSLTLNQRASNSHLLRKTSTSHLPSPSVASPSPTPMRRSVSSNVPSTPMAAAISKLTPRSGLRQPSFRAKHQKNPEPIRTETPESPMSKSDANKAASQSLRDTIAKARAANRARADTIALTTSGYATSSAASNDLDGFNFSTDDPFNQAILGEGGSTKVLKQRIKTARVEGRLNISNLQLKGIPGDVYKMYDTTPEELEATGAGDGPKWYESVDLVRFVGADNEIEEIGEEMVMQFRGLSNIDMHNNLLTALPRNFGELTELTVLNLTNNRLDNTALEIIFQILTLVDLKLAKNKLDGELPSSVAKLEKLEILELQENKLESLPTALGEIQRLHVLNVASNRLSELPFQAFKRCQLHELTVANNKLKGSLFSDVRCLDSLHLLDIRNNQISIFSEGTILLPTLQQLFATNNNISSFPSVEGWDELLVFTVDHNHLEVLPEGLMSLQRLRTLDFSANNIKSLDPRLGLMGGLEILKFDGNPFRERNLLGMGIVDLKRTLKARLAPPEIVIAEVDDQSVDTSRVGEGEGGEIVLSKSTFEIGRGGVLELSSKEFEDVPMALLETVTGSPDSVILLHNRLTAIPASLETFSASLTTLNMGHNKLSGDSYLTMKISLRSLTTLMLQANSITSLQPLLDNLDAPKLETLDVSANRLVSIAGIRPTFPNLVALYARDNQVEEIPVDAVDGMRVLDLNSNSIGHLPPRLGTVTSLRELRVGGNLFRVPRWQVLEKGTEGVMEWLRDRLPADEE